MRLQFWKQRQPGASSSLYLKCASIFVLFLLSMLIAACGNNGNSQANPAGPDVTVTIRLGQSDNSPTPPLPAYNCGAWTTNTSPAYSTNLAVNIFAKYVHNVGGNPVGVPNANATASVLWPDGSIDNIPATTSQDGLAVFSVVVKPVGLNKVVLITVAFTNPNDGSTCNVSGDQAAYFTLVIAKASATAKPGGTPPTVGPSPGSKKTH